MDLGLAGKVVIVTGGASNIGRAICLAFASEGANVVIADIDEKGMETVVNLANAMDAAGRTMAIKTDVTKFEGVTVLIDKTLGKFHQIDVLVTSVGRSHSRIFVEDEPELWDQVIAINYTSYINCLRAVLPHMIERKTGVVVGISSDAARMGENREVVYSGAKAGIIASAKSIAREVGRYGIRVNTICPGMTYPAPNEVGEYSMFTGRPPLAPERLEKILKNYPLRKLGKPQDVANAVLFLASDVAAGNITGQTLGVNGGYSM